MATANKLFNFKRYLKKPTMGLPVRETTAEMAI